MTAWWLQFRAGFWHHLHTRLVAASVGFELYAAWVFLMWGLSIATPIVLGLLGYSVSPRIATRSANILLDWMLEHSGSVGLTMTVIGLVHLCVLLLFPWSKVLAGFRKICQGVEWLFWLALFAVNIAGAGLDARNWLAVILYIPFVVLLFVALCRWVYQEWT